MDVPDKITTKNGTVLELVSHEDGKLHYKVINPIVDQYGDYINLTEKERNNPEKLSEAKRLMIKQRNRVLSEVLAGADKHIKIELLPLIVKKNSVGWKFYVEVVKEKS